MTASLKIIEHRLAQGTELCVLAVAFFLPLSLDFATGFLALGSVLWMGRIAASGRLDFRPTPLDAVIAFFVIWTGISITASPDQGFSYYNYYHLMSRYVVLYYLMVNNIRSHDQLKKVVLAVLASASLVALYGFFQYLHGLETSAQAWVDGEQFPELKLRVFSTLHNPNLLAGFLVTLMTLAGGLALYLTQPRARILLSIFIVLLGGCLVLTYSRGAWVSVLAIIGLFGLIHNPRLLWLALVIPVAAFLGHHVIIDRLMSIANPTDTSSMLRLALWESTGAMIMDKPLFGIGWGAYFKVYPQYDFFIQDPATIIYHAHNMFLHIAAESGVPALIAFCVLLFGHARMALKIAKQGQRRWLSGLMLGAFGALFGLAVSGMTDYILFSTQMSMLFWLLCAMVAAARLNTRMLSAGQTF